MIDEACRAVKLPVTGLAAERDAVLAFTARVASRLGLGEPYLFPTAVVGVDGRLEELCWCANGWTPEGVSLWLNVGPREASLSVGQSLRPRPVLQAVREAFQGGDRRLERVDLPSLEGALAAALDEARG